MQNNFSGRSRHGGIRSADHVRVVYQKLCNEQNLQQGERMYTVSSKSHFQRMQVVLFTWIHILLFQCAEEREGTCTVH